MKPKPKTHSEISALGGRKKSAAKTKANKKKIKAYWAAVKAGKLEAPKRK